MPTSYKYRLLKGASWGIAIDICGEASTATAVPRSAVEVTDGLWLQIDVGWQLTDDEVNFLKLGLQRVAGAIGKARPGDRPVLIRLTGLDFNPTDYQPEGLAAAIAEWAAQEFVFPMTPILARFDRDRNRYVFAFDWDKGVKNVIGHSA